MTQETILRLLIRPSRCFSCSKAPRNNRAGWGPSLNRTLSSNFDRRWSRSQQARIHLATPQTLASERFQLHQWHETYEGNRISMPPKTKSFRQQPQRIMLALKNSLHCVIPVASSSHHSLPLIVGTVHPSQYHRKTQMKT